MFELRHRDGRRALGWVRRRRLRSTVGWPKWWRLVIDCHVDAWALLGWSVVRRVSASRLRRR